MKKKDKKVERQKRKKDQKEILILPHQGSFAILQCFESKYQQLIYLSVWVMSSNSNIKRNIQKLPDDWRKDDRNETTKK